MKTIIKKLKNLSIKQKIFTHYFKKQVKGAALSISSPSLEGGGRGWVIKKITNLHLEFIKFLNLKILGKKYLRTGKCKACGKCCHGIHVRHSKHLIKDEEEFEKLKEQHYFYNYLEIIDKNEWGLIFACTKVHPETGKCTVYSKRARICKVYPQEELFMMGGEISEDCGYSFVPIQSFEEVFKKVTKKFIL